MNQYLASTLIIDWQTQSIRNKAAELAHSHTSDIDIAKACFEFVRDEIKHSWDFQLNPVTYKASDVLKHGTGFCYAKSHLLAALLRANGIPAGFCYQRLTITDDKPPFCLHGLNAVFLSDYGWYRIDARGNKKGVQAEFCPPMEALAFLIITDGEIDLPEIWSEPSSEVLTVLMEFKTIQQVVDNLPDIALIHHG